MVDQGLATPLDRLARDLAIVARDHPALQLAIPRGRWLRRLTLAACAVQARLCAAETSISDQLAAATARVEDQKRRLETLLLDLTEGVLVCDLDHQVLLFNQSAADLLDQPQAVGLGRSLLAALSRDAILHHLDRLLHRDPAGAAATERFVCATVTAGRLRRARMALMTDHSGAPSGYVLTLADAGTEFDEAALGDRMLRTAIERQRGMLGSLRAAAETLAGVGTTCRLTSGNGSKRSCCTRPLASPSRTPCWPTLDESRPAAWLMSEVHTGDLIASLRRRLGARFPMEDRSRLGCPTGSWSTAFR